MSAAIDGIGLVSGVLGIISVSICIRAGLKSQKQDK